MTTREELDALSAKELHDRAMRLAKRRLDVAFLWRLIETIPAAEAAAGDLDRSDADVLRLINLWNDIPRTDEPPLADALRPFYIDYLMEHQKGDGA
jgi:hypothetical protein